MSSLFLSPRRARLAPAIAFTAFAAFALTACGGDKAANDAKTAADNDPTVNVAFGDSSQRNVALGPNDVRIVSTDNVLVLSLIGNTVRMQLSDSLRNSIAKNIDSSTAEKGAIGNMIAKTVGAAVSGAMGFVVRIPARDVQNLRLEDGHIRFDTRDKNVNIHADGNRGENSIFAETDAKKFIDAVKKKQHASGAM